MGVNLRHLWHAAVGATLVAGLGCAHAGTGHFNRDSWTREITKKDVDPATVVYPFDSTPDMEAWAREAVKRYAHLGSTSQLEALQTAMFDSAFDFTYDDDLTLTAAEAFRERHGNCMSFTALFIAMARSTGIPVFLMSVRRAPNVDLDQDLVVVNHHVVAGYRTAHKVIVYDFYVTSSAPFIQQRAIDDVMASAMYHNNLGGLAIRRGDLARASRDLAIAAALAPDWAPAWVNTGVARFRSGDADGALQAYDRALEADPNNSSALTNIAYVYRQLGREEEAENALRAAAHSTTNPFTLVAMADLELVRGNVGGASRYLRRAKRWFPREPAVYEALARVASAKGDGRREANYQARAAELRRMPVEGGG